MLIYEKTMIQDLLFVEHVATESHDVAMCLPVNSNPLHIKSWNTSGERRHHHGREKIALFYDSLRKEMKSKLHEMGRGRG